MNVLIACEESGIVRDAFIALGHNAMSCDLKPTAKPGPHYQGDVLDILYASYSESLDLVIAHPDCTFLTNAGVRWLDTDIKRWKQMYDACQFFNKFLDHPCKKMAVENPIPHKYALGWLRHGYTQLIQPWMFGHTEKKATCLWLKGLQPLKPTNDVRHLMVRMPKRETDKVHYMSPGPLRAMLRSRTYQGIADAFAAPLGGDVRINKVAA